jgi:hypothetical protein
VLWTECIPPAILTFPPSCSALHVLEGYFPSPLVWEGREGGNELRRLMSLEGRSRSIPRRFFHKFQLCIAA